MADTLIDALNNIKTTRSNIAGSLSTVFGLSTNQNNTLASLVTAINGGVPYTVNSCAITMTKPLESASPRFFAVRGITEINNCYTTNGSLNYTFDNNPQLLKISNIAGTIKSITATFNGCTKLTAIGTMDTSACSSFFNMFKNCSSLTQAPELNVSGVTTSTSASAHSGMFSGCTALTTLTFTDENAWKFKASVDFSSCPLTHDVAVNLLNRLETMTADTTKSIIFSAATFATLTTDEVAIGVDKFWTVSGASA